MRQAVIVIHGIGEQKPMGTLRPFVEAVLDSSEDDAGYFSKPHRMSELFELRCLRAGKRPKTDFYEYYWAYNVEGTKVLSVLGWVLGLVRRPSRDVSPGLLSLWVISRILVSAFLVSAALGFVTAASSFLDGIAAYSVGWFFIALLALAVQYGLVRYLGDAARYLSPAPRNIKIRQRIRSEGLQLLRNLHESGRYDRIVMVGHSLGSVIAYDLLTHYWTECNRQNAHVMPGNEDNARRQALHAFIRECFVKGKRVQNIVGKKLAATGERLAVSREAMADAQTGEDCDVATMAYKSQLNTFQQAQKDAFVEQRMLGNPWLVSDLVTLGSPLSHAMILMASSAKDFQRRQQQRELPTCPPQRDEKGYGFNPRRAIEVGADANGRVKRFVPLILHHAAPFAITRWTNLYFPARRGLFGDIIGGPVAPVFGAGVKDVAVRLTREWLSRSPGAHVRYWMRERSNDPGDLPREREGDVVDEEPALEALRAAIALDQLKDFREPRIPRVIT